MGIVKVGVLASGSAGKVAFDADGHTSGFTMAEIAATNEFGTVDGRIPARSMIRMPLETKSDELYGWMKSKKAEKMIVEGQTDKMLEQLGGRAEVVIQEAFDSRGFGLWKPNAPATIDKKGSSSPLIDTSEFRKSFSSEVVKDAPTS